MRYKIQKINSMKKLVYVFIAIGFTGLSLMAQSDPGDKKVKLGIIGTPSVNWLTPGNTNTMSGNGATIKAGIGIAADFRLTDVIWFHTGLEYTSTGGNIAYKSTDTVGYYYNGGVIQKTLLGTSSPAGSTPYRLLDRKYKAGFVHIPIGFRLKTKEIGVMTYFGQIGGDLYVKTSAKGDDDVSIVTPVSVFSANKTNTLTNNDLNSVVNFFNAGVHIGAGAEYRFSGSTCLIGSITYQRGLLNYTSVGTDYLTKVSAISPNFSQFNNASKLSQIVLSLGIMF